MIFQKEVTRHYIFLHTLCKRIVTWVIHLRVVSMNVGRAVRSFPGEIRWKEVVA